MSKEYGGMGLGPLGNALVQMELGESMLGALSMNTQGPDDASMMTILEQDEVHKWRVGRNVIKAFRGHGTTKNNFPVGQFCWSCKYFSAAAP